MTAAMIIQLIEAALGVVGPLLAHDNAPMSPSSMMLSHAVEAFHAEHGKQTTPSPA